jgi:hypothetical protein
VVVAATVVGGVVVGADVGGDVLGGDAVVVETIVTEVAGASVVVVATLPPSDEHAANIRKLKLSALRLRCGAFTR